MLTAQTEDAVSVNGLIRAKLTGPFQDVRMTAWLASARGISPADTKLLAGWFKNEALVSKFAGRFGFMREIDGKLAVRVYDERDLAYQLDIERPLDMDTFAMIGKYYGYRHCCADYFAATKGHGIRPHLDDYESQAHHYIHCPKCVKELMPDGTSASYNSTLVEEEIRNNRICPTPYPCTAHNSWVQIQVLDAAFRGRMPVSFTRANTYQPR